MKFDVMDSTFLQAIFECGDKGVSIYDMIVIIDFVDRSIPTYEMYIGALGRLSKSGLILEKDGKYYTSNYTNDTKKTMKKTNNRRRQVHIISEFLEVWERESSVHAKKCKMLTRRKYDEALKYYLKNF